MNSEKEIDTQNTIEAKVNDESDKRKNVEKEESVSKPYIP